MRRSMSSAGYSVLSIICPSSMRVVARIHYLPDLFIRDVGMNRKTDFGPAQSSGIRTIAHDLMLRRLHRLLIESEDGVMLRRHNSFLAQAGHEGVFVIGIDPHGKQVPAG